MKSMLFQFAFMLVAAPVAMGQAISTEELRASLLKRQNAQDSMRIEFTDQSYHGRGRPCAPEQLGEADLICERRCVVHHAVTSFRSAETYEQVGDRLQGRANDLDILTWNGIEARRFGRPGAEGGKAYLTIMAEPDLGFAIDHYMTWLGWWVFSNMGKHSLVDVLDLETTTGPVLLADGRTQWRGSYAPHAAEFLLTAARIDGEVRLVEAEVRNYYGGEIVADEGMIQNAARFEFSEFGDGQAGLPGRAEVHVCFWRMGHPKDSSEADFWGRTSIKLIGATPAECTPETFKVLQQDAASIVDERFQVAYDVGSRFITVDGRVLKTHEPVTRDDVGQNLDWWVSRGTWVDAEEAKTNQAPNADPAKDADANIEQPQTQPSAEP